MKTSFDLASTDKLYKTLFTNLRDSILVIDKNRHIINCNPAFTKLFNYTLSEMKGRKPLFVYVHKKDYTGVGKLLRLPRRNRFDVPEIEFKKKNGKTFPGEVTFSVLRDESDQITGFMGMVRDLTARKRREKERELLLSKAQQEQRLRFLAEASEIFASSLDYKKTLANVAKLIVPRFADWCSIDILNDDRELINIALIHKDVRKTHLIQKIREHYPPQQENKGMQYVVNTGKTEILTNITGSIMRTLALDKKHLALMKRVDVASSIIVPLRGREKIFGGMIFVRGSKSKPFTNDDVLLAEQLAGRAGLAIDNALLYERAKEGIKIRDEFLNIASHELKTPLTSLQLQLQLLAHMSNSSYIPSLQLQQCVDVSERQVKKLSQLINNLLDASRISNQKLSLQLEEVNLSQLVHDVIDRLQITAKNSGSKLILHNSQTIVGHWDKLRLDQVATNLLANALKYGKGKPVTVEIGKKGKTAFLSVRDKGVGISDREFGKIFRRFERTENARQFGGLGMGLYIANQIVQAHKGVIKVESKPGEGSRFNVYLPLKPEEHESTLNM